MTATDTRSRTNPFMLVKHRRVFLAWICPYLANHWPCLEQWITLRPFLSGRHIELKDFIEKPASDD